MFKLFVFLVVVTFIPQTSLAEGRANHFKVKYVRADVSGKGYVRFDQPITHSPASCGSSHSHHLAFDTNTHGGRAIYSLVLAAHATGKKIQAYGTNSCHIYSSVESWSWGFIVND